MMLFAKITDIDVFHATLGSMCIMPVAQDGGYQSTDRSRTERPQARERGQSRIHEQRSVTKARGRQAPRQQRKVQAEDDGAVLLCRD